MSWQERRKVVLAYSFGRPRQRALPAGIVGRSPERLRTARNGAGPSHQNRKEPNNSAGRRKAALGDAALLSTDAWVDLSGH